MNTICCGLRRSEGRFHAVKNLTTAEGGAITWLDREGIDNDELYNLFMLYSLHGQRKNPDG